MRKPRRKGGTLKDGERRQLARASRHGSAPALPSAGRRGTSAAAVAEAHVVAMKARLLSGR